MLEEVERELHEMIERLRRLETAAEKANDKGLDDAIASLQARVPNMTRTEDPLPMYDTPEEAIEASKDPSKNRMKSLEDNCVKYIEEGR